MDFRDRALQKRTITALALKALVSNLDLKTYFYNGFRATLDTAIIINKARYLA